MLLPVFHTLHSGLPDLPESIQRKHHCSDPYTRLQEVSTDPSEPSFHTVLL